MTLQMPFFYNRKSFKKSHQFLKYARAYLRKGRLAPDIKVYKALFMYLKIT